MTGETKTTRNRRCPPIHIQPPLKERILMRIDIITVLPEMLEGFVHESILARAQKKGLAEIHLHNLRWS